MTHDWCHRHAGSLRIAVHVQPGARVSEVVGESGDALKIRLQAPPVDGKANAELIKLVAAHFDVAKAAVNIKSGAASRVKHVMIGV